MNFESARRVKNYQKWLAAAVATHADRFAYDHARADFETQKRPRVTVVCKAHERSFQISPHDHLRYLGGGCLACEFAARSEAKFAAEKAKFLAWFEAERADRFELSSAFLGMTTAISVRCREHGTMEVTKPTYLKAGHAVGCKACSLSRRGRASRLSEDALRRELAESMPDGVRIEEVFFDQAAGATRVRVRCEVHGVRTTDAAYLRRSAYKCAECGNAQTGHAASRFKKLVAENNKGLPTWLGVMEVDVFGIASLKVGISGRGLEARYGADLKTIFFSACLDEIDALVIERRVHRAFHAHRDERILKAGMRSGKRWSGDTECYWFRQKEQIIRFVADAITQAAAQPTDYRQASIDFEIAHQVRDVARPKDLTNVPRSVVCIDTNEVFPSIAEAARAHGISHGNLSMVLSGRRRLAGGCRWAYAEEAEQVRSTPLRVRLRTTKAVRCTTTQEVFQSISDAARAKAISGSHITSVCKGKRLAAGGVGWEYVDAVVAAPDGIPEDVDTQPME